MSFCYTAADFGNLIPSPSNSALLSGRQVRLRSAYWSGRLTFDSRTLYEQASACRLIIFCYCSHSFTPQKCAPHSRWQQTYQLTRTFTPSLSGDSHLMPQNFYTARTMPCPIACQKYPSRRGLFERKPLCDAEL